MDWMALVSRVSKPYPAPMAFEYAAWRTCDDAALARLTRLGPLDDTSGHYLPDLVAKLSAADETYWHPARRIDPRRDMLIDAHVWQSAHGNLFLSYSETGGHMPEPRLRLLRPEILADPAHDWHPKKTAPPVSQIRVRACTPDDAETLAHIGAATFIDSYTSDIDGPAMVAHCTREHAREVYAAYLSASSTALWLAEHAVTGAPVGYAVLCPPDLPVALHAGDLELKRIYVLSRFHGTGTGRALLAVSEAAAKTAGAPRLLLGTYQDNHRAMAFYARQGFTQIGTRKFQVGDNVYDDVVLAKTL